MGAAAGGLNGVCVLPHEALAVVGLVIAVGLVGVEGVGEGWILDRPIAGSDG